jgi:competence ComEA-like helix-hairpin-helix protein
MEMKRGVGMFVLIMVMGMLLAAGSVGNAQTKTPGKPPVKAPEAVRIDINKATADQLTKCGISPNLAKAIVEYRDKSGPFKSSEDLLKVKGMTKELLNKLNPKAEKGVLYITPSAEDDDEPDLKPSKC